MEPLRKCPEGKRELSADPETSRCWLHCERLLISDCYLFQLNLSLCLWKSLMAAYGEQRIVPDGAVKHTGCALGG